MKPDVLLCSCFSWCRNQSCTLGALHAPQVLGEEALLLGRCFSLCQWYTPPLTLLRCTEFLLKSALHQGYLLPPARLEGCKLRFLFVVVWYLLYFGVCLDFSPGCFFFPPPFWLVKGKLRKRRVRGPPTWRTQLEKDGSLGVSGTWLRVLGLRWKLTTADSRTVTTSAGGATETFNIFQTLFDNTQISHFLREYSAHQAKSWIYLFIYICSSVSHFIACTHEHTKFILLGMHKGSLTGIGEKEYLTNYSHFWNMQLENAYWSGEKKWLFGFGDQSHHPTSEQAITVAQH